MKTIKSENYRKMASLKEHPPVPGEENHSPIVDSPIIDIDSEDSKLRKKKKKKIYQNGVWVADVNISDVYE